MDISGYRFHPMRPISIDLHLLFKLFEQLKKTTCDVMVENAAKPENIEAFDFVSPVCFYCSWQFVKG